MLVLFIHWVNISAIQVGHQVLHYDALPTSIPTLTFVDNSDAAVAVVAIAAVAIAVTIAANNSSPLTLQDQTPGRLNVSRLLPLGEKTRVADPHTLLYSDVAQAHLLFTALCADKRATRPTVLLVSRLLRLVVRSASPREEAVAALASFAIVVANPLGRKLFFPLHRAKRRAKRGAVLMEQGGGKQAKRIEWVSSVVDVGGCSHIRARSPPP